MIDAPAIADKEPEVEQTDLHELHGKVCADVASRTEWLNRQSRWYAMRHDGIRRKSKPFPQAADMHFPLVDGIIEKLKPFYFNQLFATETVAQFIAADPALVSFAGDVGYWFDYRLKQKSNLEREALVAIDKMLMAGHAPVKVYWDANTPDGKGRLAFDAIEPQHCIVPESTESLEDADRVTLVSHLTAEAYKRDKRFTEKGDDFIKSISGKGSEHVGESAADTDAKSRREGITFSDDDETIIVWEIWVKKAAGWMVYWISPLDPDKPLRASQKNPFAHKKLPVIRFDVEVKDKGHYSSRGVPERSGTFEASLNRTWNEKLDAMTFSSRPLFTSQSPIPNAGNLRFNPGQLLPFGVSAIQMPTPPISFDAEMQQTREVAEYHAGMPDFGLAGRDGRGGQPTATEVDKISSLMNVNVDLRARTFRMALGQLLQLAWQTLLQYDQDTQFFTGEELKKLDPKALQTDAWMIQPNGSTDSWNKPANFQRAVMRKQLFAQSPWIDQAELDKTILELDDPRLVQRLFRDPQDKQRSEYEAEGLALPSILLGLPLPSHPQDDQAVRIKCLLDFMEQRGKLGHPVDPQAVAAIDARIKSHLKALSQKNPKQAQAIAQRIDQLSQMHAANVVQMGQPPPQALPGGAA